MAFFLTQPKGKRRYNPFVKEKEKRTLQERREMMKCSQQRALGSKRGNVLMRKKGGDTPKQKIERILQSQTFVLPRISSMGHHEY